MIGFQHQGVDPVQYADKCGRSCFCMTLAKDKREKGKYGDSEQFPLWRNQLSELYAHKRDEIVSFSFSLLFPNDYPLCDSSYATVCEFHSRYKETLSLFVFQVSHGDLVIKHRGKIIIKDLIIPEEWVDFKIEMHMKNHDKGWMKIWRNGIEVLNYIGSVMMDKDERMYFKIGDYVWSSKERPVEKAWGDIRYRRLFFQI